MQFESWVSERLERQEMCEAMRGCLRVSLLYFPGRTLSKVNVMELTLPESWRLRFSPWRLTDCRVTSRSPQVSTEKRQEGSIRRPSGTTAHVRTLDLGVLHATYRSPPEGSARAPLKLRCSYLILQSTPHAGHQYQARKPPVVKGALPFTEVGKVTFMEHQGGPEKKRERC